MGWFFEDKTILVPTGKVIAEERSAGSGWTELGKLIAIVAAIWLIGSASADHPAQPVAPPAAVQPSPAATDRTP
jgi:hypothetical protein